jgi:hypothetical protein
MKSAGTTSSEHGPVLVQALRGRDDRAEALRDVCSRYGLMLLGVVSLVYFSATRVLASRKPMWNDELLTYFIAQARTLSSSWSALLTGADQNPFPCHVLTRWCLAVFGANEWARRLPEMIGIWGAGACLFSLLSKLGAIRAAKGTIPWVLGRHRARAGMRFPDSAVPISQGLAPAARPSARSAGR